MALITLGANSGKGKVLQVKQTLSNTTTSVSGTTYGDAISVSITPSSTSSKILLTTTANVAFNNGGHGGYFRFVRGSTGIYPTRSVTNFNTGFFLHPNQDANLGFTLAMEYLDSPSSASEQTYKLQMRCQNASSSVLINRIGSGTASQEYSWVSESTLTAMEIAG